MEVVVVKEKESDVKVRGGWRGVMSIGCGGGVADQCWPGGRTGLMPTILTILTINTSWFLSSVGWWASTPAQLSIT